VETQARNFGSSGNAVPTHFKRCLALALVFVGGFFAHVGADVLADCMLSSKEEALLGYQNSAQQDVFWSSI